MQTSQYNFCVLHKLTGTLLIRKMQKVVPSCSRYISLNLTYPINDPINAKLQNSLTNTCACYKLQIRYNDKIFIPAPPPPKKKDRI